MCVMISICYCGGYTETLDNLIVKKQRQYFGVLHLGLFLTTIFLNQAAMIISDLSLKIDQCKKKHVKRKQLKKMVAATELKPLKKGSDVTNLN